MGKRLFNLTLEPWIVYVEMRRVRAEQLRSALSKLTNRALRRALLAWAQLIVDEVEERHVAETDARHNVESQSLMAEVDRLGIDNRRLIRQVEQMMSTDDVTGAPSSIGLVLRISVARCVVSPSDCRVAAELGIEARSSVGGSAAGTPRRRKGGSPVEVAGLSNLESEVSKLHNVIAEMAEREERLLRMLQLPDVKPEPAPIKHGDFVRRNRALIHHASVRCCMPTIRLLRHR